MHNSETVLIVDNDELTLIELERVLENAGFDTTTTWDVTEAIQLLNRSRYDHVVLGEGVEGLADQLAQNANSDSHVCVMLSARNAGENTARRLPGPAAVCNRRADEVLRAMHTDRDCVLARAA